MPRDRHAHEESLLKAFLPWLSRELNDSLDWLGRPEDPEYNSRCRAARSVQRPLDAEVKGERLQVALEHTTLDSFPGQRRFGALFAELRDEIRSLKSLIPPGNNVHVDLSLGSIREGLTKRDVRKVIPEVMARLCAYLIDLPTNPPQSDIVQLPGALLEEPAKWCFEPFSIVIRRGWMSRRSHIAFRLEPNDSQWQHGVPNCLERALRDKLQDKAESFEAYRGEGWFVVLVLQISDFQLSSTAVASEFFRQIAPEFEFGSVDGIALVDQIDENDKTPECCWAYLQGEVRTANQQHDETCESLGIELGPGQ